MRMFGEDLLEDVEKPGVFGDRICGRRQFAGNTDGELGIDGLR